jgi:hypothetical protein
MRILAAADPQDQPLGYEAWYCDVGDHELHVRSEWSDLEWSPPDAELDHVLVSHDGET